MSDTACLVAVEGINNAGKTTLVDALAPRMERVADDVVRFGFSTDSAVGTVASDMLYGDRPFDPWLFVALSTAVRLEDRPAIVDALGAGSTAISDRYSQSAYAYGRALGLDPGWVRSLEEPMPAPRYVVLLDVPAEVAVERQPAGETPDYFERRPELLADVRKTYLQLAEERAEGPEEWVVVDATRPEEAVLETVAEALLD